eukprot:TRINITY_DN13645_c0_g1_i1.p1 TRINITY_DN13645_c0_g1~~TRINITY_DN13645_c0_g1_i1.p1  ORF type:complete len:429 (+),score=61.83 TRINITY_DN13645_c0_g1_i1:100-1386(+)
MSDAEKKSNEYNRSATLRPANSLNGLDQAPKQNPLSLSSGSIPNPENTSNVDNTEEKSLSFEVVDPDQSPKAKKKGIKNFFSKTVPSIFTFGLKKNTTPNANNSTNGDKSSEEQTQSNNTATAPMTLPNMANAIMKQANADMTVWGVSLQIAARRSDPRGLVPLPISKAISFVEAHGLDVEGLYRIPAKKSRIEEIRDLFDKGKGDFVVFGEHGIREATGTLVNYINNLPEPIYTRALAPSLHAAAALRDLKQIREVLKQLPAPNKETLKTFCVHLNKVSKSSEQNKMNIDNLATSFGPDYSKILPILVNNIENVFAETIAFGVALDKVLQRSVYEVPEVLITCFLLIETYPFDRRYIYYQSGDLNRIRHLKMQFNSGEIVALEPNDIHNATGVVKMFFSELPESVFTSTLESYFVKVKGKPPSLSFF